MNSAARQGNGATLEAFCLNRAAPLIVVSARPGAEFPGAGGQLARWNPAAVLTIAGASGVALHARALALAGIGAERLPNLGFSQGAAVFELAEITRQLARVFALYGPRILVTHAYEGGDPDQDAVAFAVQNACVLLGENAPLRIEATGSHHWAGRVRTGHFLPAEGSPGLCTLRLSESQRALKAAMLAHFPTLPLAAPVDDAISRELDPQVERFRVAPRYDFGRPPHAGPLLYELGGGLGSLQWRAQAIRALGELF